MAVIDVVSYQSIEDDLIWKFPSTEIKYGSQVIVGVAQRAFFIKGGKIVLELESGTHTLGTDNIPILSNLVNKPFGGNTPFQAEVWFVNLVSKLNNKWGTPAPIQIEDPKYGIVVPLRTFGQYGFKVSNPKLFLENLVGNLTSYSAEKVQEFFRGKIITSIVSLIAKKIITDSISILEISIYLNELSIYCQEGINNEFEKFGLEIVNFFIVSISIPQDDPSFLRLKHAKDLFAKVKITGKELYQMDRSFNVLEKAAQNEGGVAGNLIGAGLGLGLGAGVGNQMKAITDNIKTNDTHTNLPPTLYYAIIDEQQTGPFDISKIKQLIEDRKINNQTMAWKQGMENWQEAKLIDELALLLNQIPPPIK